MLTIFVICINSIFTIHNPIPMQNRNMTGRFFFMHYERKISDLQSPNYPALDRIMVRMSQNTREMETA